MKKLNNKKGLFLAEILLAVVIAAVIMGSGFLVYKNIKSENEKNDAIRDINMIVSMVTPMMSQERGQGVQYDTSNSGRLMNNTKLIKTRLLAQAKMLPTTMKVTNERNLMTSYGYPASIGLNYNRPNSNWRLMYHQLDRDQCSKLVAAAIEKVRPMAIGTNVANRSYVNKSITSGRNWPVRAPRYRLCTKARSLLDTVSYLCIDQSAFRDTRTKIDVTFWFSPNNENLTYPMNCTAAGLPSTSRQTR